MSSYKGGFPSSEPKHLKPSRTLSSSNSNKSCLSNNHKKSINTGSSNKSTNKKRQNDGNIVTRSKQAKPAINLQTTNNRISSSLDNKNQSSNENQATNKFSQQDNDRLKTTHRRPSEIKQHSFLQKTPNTTNNPSKESFEMQPRSATAMQSSVNKTPNPANASSRESYDSNEFQVSRIACSEGRNSVSEVSVDTLLDRVDRLEQIVLNIQSTVEKYKNAFARHNSSCEAVVKLDQYHCNIIKDIVQNELFKSVKFFDNLALLRIGDEIVKRVLIMSNANPNKITDRPFYNAVISRTRLAMSTHKCHIKSKIRKKTADLLIVTQNDSNINKLWFVYINYFRVGEFDNAPNFIQDAWCQFCQHVLLFVNKKFNCKVTQLHTNVSQVCTISDEAFAMQIGNTHMCHWIYHYVNGKDNNNQYVPVFINPIEYEHDFFAKTNFLNGNSRDEEDDEEVTKDGSTVADKEDANNHDEDDDNEDQDMDDKDTEAQPQDNNFDGCYGEEVSEDKGEQRQYNKLNTKAYHATCTKLHNIKTNKYQEWISWDNGFRQYINKTNVPSEVAVTEKETGDIAVPDYDDTVQMEYEPW